MIRRLKRILAQRKLARDVTQRRNSYEVQRYAEKRAAAKLGWERRLVGRVR